MLLIVASKKKKKDKFNQEVKNLHCCLFGRVVQKLKLARKEEDLSLFVPSSSHIFRNIGKPISFSRAHTSFGEISCPSTCIFCKLKSILSDVGWH